MKCARCPEVCFLFPTSFPRLALGSVFLFSLILSFFVFVVLVFVLVDVGIVVPGALRNPLFLLFASFVLLL